MSELERQEFENRICAMSEEEKNMALKHIETDMLLDELRRRETSSRNILQGVRDMVNVCD